MQARKKIVIIGDSTIDNQLDLGTGVYGAQLRTMLGLKKDSRETRIKQSHRKYFRPALSITEQLQDQLPGHEIIDLTNAGFTTTDILNGGKENKALHGKSIDTYPDVEFKPLDNENIPNADVIVLCVGGDDIRTFLESVAKLTDEEARRNYITNFYYSTLKEANDNLLKIAATIHDKNNNAKIVFTLPYHLPAVQENHKLYPALEDVRRYMDLGKFPCDALMHMYRLAYDVDTKNNKITVANLSAAVNPYDRRNFTSNDTLSENGGRLASSILVNAINSEGAPVSSTSTQLRAPHDFCDTEADRLLREIANSCNTFNGKNPDLIKAADEVFKEGTRLLETKQPNSYDMRLLVNSLALTCNALKFPRDIVAINALKYDANNSAIGRARWGRKFIGAVLMVISALSLALSLAALAVTGGISLSGVVINTAIFTGGALLFNSGRQKSMAKAEANLEEAIQKEIRNNRL